MKSKKEIEHRILEMKEEFLISTGLPFVSNCLKSKIEVLEWVLE